MGTTALFVASLLVAVALLSPAAAQYDTFEADRLAMIDIVNQNGGVFGVPSGPADQGIGDFPYDWKSDSNADPCGVPQWAHIVCNGTAPNKRVTSISIENWNPGPDDRNGGTMPTAFARLSELQVLRMVKPGSAAQMIDAIPEAWCNLTKLEYLELKNLGGTDDDSDAPRLPDCMASLPDLKVVNIDTMQLRYPPSIAWQQAFDKATPLEVFRLHSTSICGRLLPFNNTAGTNVTIHNNCVDSSLATSTYCANDHCDNFAFCTQNNRCYNFWDGQQTMGRTSTTCECDCSALTACPGGVQTRQSSDCECACRGQYCASGVATGTSCACDCSATDCNTGTMNADCSCDCSGADACPPGSTRNADCSCGDVSVQYDQARFELREGMLTPIMSNTQYFFNEVTEEYGLLQLGPAFGFELTTIEEIDQFTGSVLQSFNVSEMTFERSVKTMSLGSGSALVTTHQSEMGGSSFLRVMDFTCESSVNGPLEAVTGKPSMDVVCTQFAIKRLLRIEGFNFTEFGNKMRVTFEPFALPINGTEFNETYTLELLNVTDGSSQEPTLTYGFVGSTSSPNTTYDVSFVTEAILIDNVNSIPLEWAMDGIKLQLTSSWFDTDVIIDPTLKSTAPYKAPVAIPGSNNESTTVIVSSGGGESVEESWQNEIEDYLIPAIVAIAGIGGTGIVGILLVAGVILAAICLCVCLCVICYCLLICICQASLCLLKKARKKKPKKKSARPANLGESFEHYESDGGSVDDPYGESSEGLDPYSEDSDY